MANYNPTIETIGNILSMTSPPVIVPDWQRNFSWTTSEVETFWQDLCRFSEQYPDETIAIFLVPPSLAELRHRLTTRGTESPKLIEHRLSRYTMEKEKGETYPYHVVNDIFDKAVEEVLKVIDTVG